MHNMDAVANPAEAPPSVPARQASGDNEVERSRNALSAFLPFLQELEADGICDLLHDEVPVRFEGVSVSVRAVFIACCVRPSARPFPMPMIGPATVLPDPMPRSTESPGSCERCSCRCERMGGTRKQDGRVAETAAGLVHEGQGRQVRRVAMGLVCRGRVLMLTLRHPRRPYKPASFYQFLRRLGYFPTETTKRATHGLDFEGSRTFKWNGSHRTKYIQSKKERETVSLEINRRSIIHGEHPAMPIFGAQVMAIPCAFAPASLGHALATARALCLRLASVTRTKPRTRAQPSTSSHSVQSTRHCRLPAEMTSADLIVFPPAYISLQTGSWLPPASLTAQQYGQQQHFQHWKPIPPPPLQQQGAQSNFPLVHMFIPHHEQSAPPHGMHVGQQPQGMVMAHMPPQMGGHMQQPPMTSGVVMGHMSPQVSGHVVQMGGSKMSGQISGQQMGAQGGQMVGPGPSAHGGQSQVMTAQGQISQGQLGQRMHSGISSLVA